MGGFSGVMRGRSGTTSFSQTHRREQLIIPQADLDLIVNRKIRQRTLTLPVKYGTKFGERKRCPMRTGGVYNLRASTPYDRYLARAREQPTRARAVLKLIDECQEPSKPVPITVLDVHRQEDNWLIRFTRGEHPDLLDRPLYLSKVGDYTSVSSKQAVPGDPEVMLPFAEDLARARAKAREVRISPQRESLQRTKGEAEAMLQTMKAMKSRNRAKLILKELDKLAVECSVEESCIVASVAPAESHAPVAAKGGPRPHGSRPLVSTEPAA